MKTLIIKNGGHEAHVPYELPSEVAVDCFVPEYGTFPAHVDLRGDKVVVTEVTGLPEWFCSHDAVLEQAGDVCAVFERALSTQDRDAQGCRDNPEDLRILSTIAEMAHAESDLHTAWCRLPERVRESVDEPQDKPGLWKASQALEVFVINVLVPRAQDMATAAAKRREAEWNEEQALMDLRIRRSHGLDLAIDLAKEGA